MKRRFTQALGATGATVQPDAPLRKLVYWRVGGPAEWLVQVRSLEQLREVMGLAREYDQPVTVLGKGSNALVHDQGISGVCLQLRDELAGLQLDGVRATAGAGMALTVLLARLDKAGLAGAEPFAGVPGTVGGAVVMNAGTTLGEARDLVEAVTVVLKGGEVRRLLPETLQFAYRHAVLPEGAVVALAELLLVDEELEQRKERRLAHLRRRKATQPLNLPSCGSTFTNPPGDHAGRLIEAAGLKGHRIGGASISDLHANFFVNHGSATADDIRRLIVLARLQVHEQFGVWLTPEVKLLGPWEEQALGPRS